LSGCEFIIFCCHDRRSSAHSGHSHRTHRQPAARGNKADRNYTIFGVRVKTPFLASRAFPFDFSSSIGYNVARDFRIDEGSEVVLANTKSAIKRMRSSERKRRANQVHRSRARTYIKKTRQLIAAGQFEEAEAMACQAASALDRAAQKGVIHKNNAARRKSRLMQQLNQARAQQAA
jgi:small subunit ribosomal protein S20